LRGQVSVDGVVLAKPAANVRAVAQIAIAGDDAFIVSRGGIKLQAGITHFAFPVQGRIALDVGASTGGFTQVLLASGAAKVYAVDVGRGQLHRDVRDDPRVVSFEATDARSLDGVMIKDPPGAIVADVSFISLTKALPAALDLASPDAWLIALVKPQFEAGRAAIGKGGIVRDQAVQLQAVDTVAAWIGARPGWRVRGVTPSPIDGGSGNREFLLGARRDD
jgi:23S rRNA (cytidine1920-2'-O)/16S rRNA (cytidine1409-2'-O)-methyltransferase